jgi:hypothetical protein
VSRLNVEADVTMLGVAGLGWQRTDEIQEFWQSAVIETGASRVIPIHWDNDQKPVPKVSDGSPTTFTPPFYLRLDRTLREIESYDGDRETEIVFAPPGSWFDPFRGLGIFNKSSNLMLKP